MEEVTKKLLKESFPYGVLVAQNTDGPNYEVVDLELRELEDTTYVFGWAYPNKDMWFPVTEVELLEDGSWLFQVDKIKTRFTALTKEQSRSVKSMMQGA